jgi:hypothetical protein
LLDAIERKNLNPLLGIQTPEGVAVFKREEAQAILNQLGQPAVKFALERASLHDLPRLQVSRAVDDGRGGKRYLVRDFSKLSLSGGRAGTAGGCAVATHGHGTVLTSPAMNARRFIRSPHRQLRATLVARQCSALAPFVIDDELEFGRLHNRQIGGLLTLQDAAHINAAQTIHIGIACSVAQLGPRSSVGGQRNSRVARNWVVELVGLEPTTRVLWNVGVSDQLTVSDTTTRQAVLFRGGDRSQLAE